MKETEYYIKLYQRYLQGDSSQEEEASLWRWQLSEGAKAPLMDLLEKQFSEEPQPRWEQQAHVQDSLMRVEQQLMQQIEESSKQKTRHMWLSYAAAVAVLLAVLTYIFIDHNQQHTIANASSVTVADIEPGSNRAVLKLSDGKEVNLSASEGGIVVRGDIRYSSGSVIEERLESLEYELITPLGGSYQVQLSDGTNVWLNAGSTLKYPSHFSGKSREVHLSGEAYFDVVHDAEKPFVIHSKKQEVLVYGTTLNVMAYDSDEVTRTTLVNGSVTVCSKATAGLPPANHLCMAVYPGEQTTLGEKSFHKKAVNSADYTAWKDGMMVFRDMPILEIIKQLERWYDISFDVTNWPSNLKLEGEVPRDIKLSGILTTLEKYTGKKLLIKGRRVYEE